MEGENLDILAEVAAPEQEIPAGPESVDTETPETQEAEKAPKTFTQEELDRIVAREKAKTERKVRREFVAPQPQQPVQTEPLNPDSFESPEAFVKALAQQEAQRLVQEREIQQRNAQIEASFAERVEAALEKYDDYEQVAYNPTLTITAEMAATIKESDLGPDIAYYLGSNPQEAERIARLTPLQQARELGKIEAKIAAEPVVKKTTSAPEPIAPVTARRTATPAYDTTDPRSAKAMTDAEWIAAENERVRRKLEAQRNR